MKNKKRVTANQKCVRCNGSTDPGDRRCQFCRGPICNKHDFLPLLGPHGLRLHFCSSDCEFRFVLRMQQTPEGRKLIEDILGPEPFKTVEWLNS